MEGELDEHLDDAQRENGNRKNGHIAKRLKTADGTIDLETPRDRSSTFDPQNWQEAGNGTPNSPDCLACPVAV